MAKDKDHKDDKTVEVIVNGRPFDVPKGEISFTTVVACVFPQEQDPQQRYAVTYERGGNENKPDGILVAGTSVKVKKGMIFHVSPTGQS